MSSEKQQPEAWWKEDLNCSLSLEQQSLIVLTFDSLVSVAATYFNQLKLWDQTEIVK